MRIILREARLVSVRSVKFILKYLYKGKRDALLTFTLLIGLAALNIAPGVIIQNIFDNGIMAGNYVQVLTLCAVLVIIYIIISFLNYKSNIIMTKWSQSIISRIRDDLSEKIIKLPMEFFNFNESGYVTARINEVNTLSSLFSVTSLKLIIYFFEFIGVCIVLLNINPILTGILLLIAPFFYIIGRKNMAKISKTSNIAIEQSAKLSNKIQQSLRGIEEVKNLAVENKESRNIKIENEKFLKSSIKQANSYAVGLELLTFLGVFSGVVLIAIGGKYVIEQNLTIGNYMVFSNYLAKLYAPMQSLSILSITAAPALVSLKRIVAFMDEISEEEEDEGKETLQAINTIEFNNISHKYNSQELFIFQNFNLHISPKDKIMIKGSNGCGKTTILRILLALYYAKSGNVMINNKNIKEFKKSSIRNRISVVSQKTYLFNGTIEENIRYGIEITDEEYMQKMSSTKLKLLLQHLPMNDAIVMENGVNLSGGQIQRIAIARGILKDVDVFLFDEATSNLDNEAVQLFKNDIFQVLSDKICIFIEHGNDFDDLCEKTVDMNSYTIN